MLKGGKALVPPNEKLWRDGLMTIKGKESIRQLNEIFASQWMALGGDVFDYKSEKYNPPVNDPGTDEVAIMSCFPGNPLNRITNYYNESVKYGEKATICNHI